MTPIPAPVPTSSTAYQRLQAFIAEHNAHLLNTLKIYVRNGGLATDYAQAETIARELLSEITIAALQHADRFDTTRHPMSWLLGIAANMVKRRQASYVRLQQREPLLRDLYVHHERSLSDDELFDWVGEQTAAVTVVNNSRDIHENEVVTGLLAQLSPSDQQVIQLAILQDMDGDSVAQALGIAPGTARMRLHRALRKLRTLLEAESPPLETSTSRHDRRNK